ncbi:MAG: helix-turn-helix transcriptional regulator [Lachnospiraceae bacterium]|nr:helix-turn-helix transcriptional regulator [Lachnospiraceae bacterium]
MNHHEIAEYITELRITHGYSQLELSEALGIGRQAYSHYETGRNLPTYQAIVKMAELYGVSTDEFISRMHLDAAKRSELEACFRIMKDQEKGHAAADILSVGQQKKEETMAGGEASAIKAAVAYMRKMSVEKQKKVVEFIRWYGDA